MRIEYETVGRNSFLICLQCVMNMPEEDPRRIESIRKYSAIYGRFDCKRKPEKPLTLHEVNIHAVDGCMPAAAVVVIINYNLSYFAPLLANDKSL